VTPFPSGGVKWQVSTNGGTAAKWRGDGKELFFLDPADNLMAVNVNTSGTTIQLGTPHILFRASGVQNTLGPYTVIGDGKKFLLELIVGIAAAVTVNRTAETAELCLDCSKFANARRPRGPVPGTIDR
jgi:hypothetical protein